MEVRTWDSTDGSLVIEAGALRYTVTPLNPDARLSKVATVDLKFSVARNLAVRRSEELDRRHLEAYLRRWLELQNFFSGPRNESAPEEHLLGESERD